MSRRAVYATFFLAIPALIAMKIYSWGGPIPADYQLPARPARLPGIRARRTRRMEAAIRNTGRRGTANGDGTWDEFTTLQGTFTRPALRTPPKRWLVVCLDDVAVGEMESMWDRGDFREFFRSTAIVSTLPSGTETVMTEVLHAVPVPGYEHIYFDRGANRTRGGFSITLTGLGIPYIRALDYDTPGWAKIVHFVGDAQSASRRYRTIPG
jgi:hypothetical protein